MYINCQILHKDHLKKSPVGPAEYLKFTLAGENLRLAISVMYQRQEYLETFRECAQGVLGGSLKRELARTVKVNILVV